MKFKKDTRRQAIDYEKDLINYWKKNKIFEKSVESRPADNRYVLYDGPPFITGVPHHGTLLSSIVKDAVPRFWTMEGKRVERVWGWDCHGLPAEVYTERKLEIKDRKEIGTKISIEDYIKACRQNMVQTGSEWEQTIERIGRWVDFSGAYRTMDKDYMESVWWAFKELYNKGKIYEGEKVLLYCTRDATPLSKAEVAMDNSYKDVTDPSVYVKFKLKGENKYLLAWTTTPWTLPSNTALAVNKDLQYSEVSVDDETFILASKLIKDVLVDEKNKPLKYRIVKTFKGKELIGKTYEPLFKDRGENAHQVWHADFIHTDEGTGVAHESPAYGEEDYLLSKLHHFPMVLDTDEEGRYIDGEWKGQLVWDANKEIAKNLQEKGVVLRVKYIQHSYPHCHRCGARLMYRAHPSWFMDIDSQRAEMLEHNSDIRWFPDHFKKGRFAKNIQQAPDWNLSRDRFWATAMPVWKGTDKQGEEHVKVIGSYAELKELSGIELDDYHRPWVDEVVFTVDGIEYKRVDKVMDSWFEAGSMPFAQFHYPFENTKKFEQDFPGDFISEYVGQVRAWFYYLHAVGVGMFAKNVYKNVVVTGTLLGNDGRKLSKSLNNYTDPNILMDEYSADALRFLLLSSPVLSGEDFVVLDKDVRDMHRKLSMAWNMYDFFTLYAEVDGWESNEGLEDPSAELSNPMDIWIVSRVHQLTKEVEKHMKRYDLPSATKPILPFIDDASNWYVRRSRKRFWKSENSSDKQQAYTTLHYVLVRLSIVLAPFSPFMAEELYRHLTRDESVHLLDWPSYGEINQILIDDMRIAREVITEGLAQRASAGFKVRQPLQKVTVPKLPDNYKSIIAEELNVKEVNWGKDKSSVVLDTTLTEKLKIEGLMRELVRFVQNARKKAGLNVEDRISLAVVTSSKKLNKALDAHKTEIMQETLATSLNDDGVKKYNYSEKIDINGEKADINLTKN